MEKSRKERRTNLKRMLGEHKNQREVGGGTGAKGGCDAEKDQVWQDTSTRS